MNFSGLKYLLPQIALKQGVRDRDDEWSCTIGMVVFFRECWKRVADSLHICRNPDVAT